MIVSPGHGWYFDESAGRWSLQRDYYGGIVEDLVNWDIARYVLDELAGAELTADETIDRNGLEARVAQLLNPPASVELRKKLDAAIEARYRDAFSAIDVNNRRVADGFAALLSGLELLEGPEATKLKTVALTKHYDQVVALAGADLEVSEGEIRTALAELPPYTLVGRIETANVAFPYAFETQLNLARGRPNARAFDYTPEQTYALRWNLTCIREHPKCPSAEPRSPRSRLASNRSSRCSTCTSRSIRTSCCWESRSTQAQVPAHAWRNSSPPWICTRTSISTC